MALSEVFAIEGDSGELSPGQPKAYIGDHRILNRGITEVTPCVWSQQCDARAQVRGVLTTLVNIMRISRVARFVYFDCWIQGRARRPSYSQEFSPILHRASE
jgi:hypothetical protein